MKSKKIAVITTTRAEYGLLAPIITKLRAFENDYFYVELVVSGTHLYKEYGHTIDEIISDGIRIDKEVLIPVNSESSLDISNNQSEILKIFTKIFEIEHYNAIIILGDRYEMLSISIAAGNTQTPIYHISGGDTTEGAMDEWIRHCITKMSYLHFPTNEVSRNRIIQMGEDPSRVFNYGSTSIDNILTEADMSKEKALESVGLSNCKYAICTYHPVTIGNTDVKQQIDEFLAAMASFRDIQFIITKSNADRGGAKINSILDEADKVIENIHVYSSLGIKRYLSLMKYAEFVLGNSSSGIVETPAFRIPTVNIGDRQKGRLQSESVINCGESREEICAAISHSMDKDFREICTKIVSPYGDGHAADKIANKVYETVCNGNMDLKKKFYDLEVNVR